MMNISSLDRATGMRPSLRSARRSFTPVRRVGPSATAFMARVVLTGAVVVMAVALLMAAPRSVTIPMFVALFAGLIATGVVASADRRIRTSRRGRAGGAAPSRADDVAPREADDRSRAGRSQSAANGSRWIRVAAAIVSLLVVAIVAPEPIGAALAAAGLAGVFALRIAASRAGWPPYGAWRAAT